MILRSLTKYRDAGLLILRIGFGLMYIWHGGPKLAGGMETWAKVGGAVSFIGINFGHTFFGLCAAMSEFAGGICVLLGFFFRPACMLMFFTMFVAAMMHLGNLDQGFKVASHAIDNGIVLFSLIFIGPGRFSIDRE